MKTTAFGRAVAATVLVFLLLDGAWLSLMAPRLYAPALGHLMREDVVLAPAALFYAVYIVGVVGLAVAPGLGTGRCGAAAARGALLGLVAYATYDLTNHATLRGWPWHVTLIDLAWGSSLTALAAAAGVAAAGRSHRARPGAS